MSVEQLSRRKTVAALAATVACTLAGALPQPQNWFPPAGRKTAPVRFSQQVQTPSFTAPKMVILFPTLRRRGGKATLGSQNTVSAHSPISITSIQHGSSSEL